MSAQPRNVATTARGAVIIGSGLALGLLSTHFFTQASVAAEAKAATTATAKKVKPKVVTVVRTKHVKSDPIIVYRQVPVSSGGGSTYTPPSSGGSYSGGSSSGGGGSNVAPAPSAPRPAPAAPPAGNSGAS